MTKNKEMAIKLIEKKLNNKTFLTYEEIGEITGYHEKYIFKLRKEYLDGSISYTHGNKNRRPINAMSDSEKEKILNLYRRSHASIRKFCKFYNSRSYSCIYNLVKSSKEDNK
jgi:hypothetical protein